MVMTVPYSICCQGAKLAQGTISSQSASLYAIVYKPEKCQYPFLIHSLQCYFYKKHENSGA